MSLWEILLNRYGVLKTLPKEEPEILRQILWQKFSKTCQKYQRKITRLPTKLIKFFLPEKSDRIRAKQAIKAKFLKFKKLFF
jgi:hypothetical protein